MKKRQIYTIGSIFLLFSLAMGMEFVFNKERNLSTYAERIENSLHAKETKVRAILNDTAFIQRQYLGIEKLTADQQRADLGRIEELTSRLFNICLYEDDSLVFWTNNRAFPNKIQVEIFKSEKNLVKLQHLPNGDYQFIKKSFNSGDNKDRYAIALIPLRNEYALESEHLQNRFVCDKWVIPKEIVLSPKETPFNIRSLNGETLAWITSRGDFKDKLQLQWILVMYLLGFIALGVLVNDIAIILVKKYHPWVGAVFLIATIFGIRFLTVQFGFSNNFADLKTFTETFSTPVLNSSSSLGDLIINIILLLWMMVFFNREFRVRKFENVSDSIRFALTGFNYFSIILGILMITGVFKSLVLNSQIAFDFDNVLNLNFYSFLAILGIILLLIALFLFSHRMMLAIVKIGLTKHQRLMAFCGALLLAIPVILMTDLALPIPHLLLFAVIYIGGFDLFIDQNVPSLTWLVIWLVIFAGFSSILLFKYNNDKDLKTMKDYAYELANFRDSLAEISFSELRLKIDRDTNLKSLAEKGELIAKERLENLIDFHFAEDKYVFHNYAFRTAAFRLNEGTSALEGDSDSLKVERQRYAGARQTVHAGLKFLLGSGNYLMKTEIPGTDPIVLFLEFEHKSSNPSKVYTELLLDRQYKDLRNLAQYDYAIYRDSLLVEEKGGQYDTHLTDSLPPEKEIKNLKRTSERAELLYHATGGVVVKIGKNMGSYLKPISLFSYIFGLLIMTVIILSILNAFTNALPEALHFSLTKTLSLRNRIQFAVILLVLISFVIIGIVTVWHYRDYYRQYHEGRLGRKVESAKADASFQIHQQYEIKGDDIDFTKMVKPLSNIHRLDVNIFSLNGDLISSSEEDIFRRGIIAPKMGGFAFQTLSKIGNTLNVQDEWIGKLAYQAAYIPLKNPEGKTLAYLGLPYYSQQRQLRSDVSGFMGKLLNVYVFLLLIAGGIAIAVANSITKPISDLGDSLKKLKLGRNEPLSWDSKDELGELIAEYNRMIKKLEESMKLLAQSEREGAWREMAKQVAHEIKNPLTPMKLSIQYMLHASRDNPDQVKPLLERSSKTLIEQIDSLSQIASEFSNFAKMPKAENSEFPINDLVLSVHNLFANERQDMDISLYSPDKVFYVNADKNHLTRVLNNLLKNAIQSIPDETKGKIDISLSQKEDKVVIEVSDNGVGISKDMHEKVFAPNFTTKTSGTGLGLAISKNIIESFNGKIYFETQEEEGTKFFVEIPLTEVREMYEVE